MHHLSQSSDKRWAELSEPEFPNYTPPEDDERTKYQAKQYNRKDDPTNRMYTAPASFSAPSVPFRKTVTFSKSSEEIDAELMLMEASKLVSKLPVLSKSHNSVCPLEEIVGTEDNGYKVGVVNESSSIKSESERLAAAEGVHPASENLVSLTSADVAHAIAAIAPIFSEYYQIFVEHQCDGNKIAQMTDAGIDTIVASLSNWGVTSSFHRIRIADVFYEWRTNPPKALPPQDHKIKTLSAAGEYDGALKKSGVLTSEIPEAVKATSIKIDQQYSHFKKLSLAPLKTAPSRARAGALNVPKSGSNNVELISMQFKDVAEHSGNLLAKYPIPLDSLSVKTSAVEEKHVSEPEVIANRLTSLSVGSDFENTAAKIRHLIETPVVPEKLALHGLESRQPCDSGSKNASSQVPLKNNQLHALPYDASPNVYSRPNLPSSRYTDASSQDVMAIRYGLQAVNTASEESTRPMSPTVLSELVGAARSEIVETTVDQSSLHSRHLSHVTVSRSMSGNSANRDLSPKKARQNSPKTGELSSRVLIPKSKSPVPLGQTEGQLMLERPSSAIHRVKWIEEAEKVDLQTDGALEQAEEAIETETMPEAMKYKSPLSIYLNVADKNFRPTKSKYNAGLQLLPLKQASEDQDVKFDSKQRSAVLRFGERTTTASANGVSASGVQFNPVSALFRSKRWKACSNYPVFTSKLKASKDLQRFARSATTPHFKTNFSDEQSMIRCIESNKTFAVHFGLPLTYDDFGDLQLLQPAEEAPLQENFFWTGQTD